jgi:putative transposase
MLNEQKVAQMAAYFLYRNGNKLSILKLMKLLYLADRESLAIYGLPLSYDHLVSMPHGPVLSETLDHSSGFLKFSPDGWDSWISDRENHEVSLRKKVDSPAALRALSPSDMEILGSVWTKFGGMSGWQLRDYTHQHCKEWKDPNGSSFPIPYKDVLLEVGVQIRLVYCRPYQPEGKGKLEKWHRTVRDQFLSELDLDQIRGLDDLNARLWAWLDRIYHVNPHSSLNGMTPIERYQQDLVRVRPLGAFAAHLDELFYHRHTRTVRKDGTVTFKTKVYEVPFELVGQTVVLVVDPHADRALTVESKEGQALGAVTPLRCTRQYLSQATASGCSRRGTNAQR